MYIIEVIPIMKGSAALDTLSYFSANKTPAGSVVRVTIRNKRVPAVVFQNREASAMKEELKSSSFALRRLGEIEGESYFTPQFMNAALDTARFHAASAGATFKTLVGAVILDSIAKSSQDLNRGNIKSPTEIAENNTLPQISAVAGNEDEIATFYKTHIREQFAKGRSALICVPTTENGNALFEKISKGLEDKVFIFNGEIKKKEIIKNWRMAADPKHTVAVISTGAFLCLHRRDWGAVIVADEGSTHWISVGRPRIDFRQFARCLAARNFCELILCGFVLSAKTYSGVQSEEIAKRNPFRFRYQNGVAVEIWDMKKNKTQKKSAPFKVIGDELEKSIRDTWSSKGNMFILTARKGSFPYTICRDCGRPVLCGKCSSQLVLYSGVKEKDRRYVCHRCGSIYDTKLRCRTCNSWNLVPLGIGALRVAESIKGLMPELPVFVLDADTAPTKSKARKIIKDFFSSPGSVLVGTKAACAYIDRPLDYSAVASIDSLFSIPNYGINEEIFRTIFNLKELAEKKFIIQTRNPDSVAIKHAISGNAADFMSEELKFRKQFKYPPYFTLIKISFKHKSESAAKSAVEKASTMFNPDRAVVYKSFIGYIKGFHIYNALLKIPAVNWPDDRFVAILKSFPPSFNIEINPENIA